MTLACYRRKDDDTAREDAEAYRKEGGFPYLDTIHDTSRLRSQADLATALFIHMLECG